MSKGPSEYTWGSADLQKCPYPYYEALREDCPVYQLPGEETFLVTEHGLVMEALKQPHTFSNRRKPLGVGDPEFEAIAAQGYPQVATLSANEPPYHTRFRRLVNPFFAPRAVAGL